MFKWRMADTVITIFFSLFAFSFLAGVIPSADFHLLPLIPGSVLMGVIGRTLMIVLSCVIDVDDDESDSENFV